MKYQIATAAALVFGMASPALAQDAAAPAATVPAPAAEVAAGAQVYGSDGTAIGTVARVEGDVALVTVGERTIPIPATAIAAGEAGPTVNITRTALVTQFDQQMAQMDAQLEAALVAGTAVQTADGQALGTIQSREDDAILVAGDVGELTLSKPMLAIGPQGSLVVRATMEQIQQAMAQAPAEG
ncbi:hypothetical protein A9995_13495 [Erythrobacter sp. QSSC1-22B]|uniref:hypothetical protein n=1 Tax=Erythrobacter sp. QSSC1-22B TaxID=1860125 RepID=UPI000804DB31|nr:hypothetical protein [Erythrobacter sp. QSSC1-22B]OBX18162.1 hypothetical protein A9995_13495 [Erythrobacter sp. QSSC1-22B]